MMPQSLKMLIHFLRLLWRNHYMIRSLVVRDLKARYVGSMMGFFWSVIHPLAQIALYYFIFAVIFKVRLGPEYGGTHFAFWMIAGLLPWLFFAEVVNKAPTSVLNQANLIKKVVFPSEIFPLVNIASAGVNHLIALAILLVALLLFGGGVGLEIFYLIPLMATASLFALGISWVLSSLNIFLRDIGQLIVVVLNLWFFATPIVYPSHLVPPSLQGIYHLNPMLYVVEGYRTALLGTSEIDPAGFAYLLVVSVGILVIGALTFRRLKPAFADVL